MMTRSAWLALSLVVLGCTARSGARTEIGSGAATTEQTVRALDEQERVAALNRDRAALERLWSDAFTVNAPNNQVLIGKAAVLALIDQGVIHFSSFDRVVETVHSDRDVVILMGSETVTPIGDSPLAGQTVHRRFTNVWKAEAGSWRLWARHANVVEVR